MGKINLVVLVTIIFSMCSFGSGDLNQPGNSMPIATYTSTYQNSGIVNLQIDTPQGRMPYAVVPQNSQISLIASTSLGGQGLVYELYPQGTYTTNTYSFNPGDNQLGFIGNIAGRHILLFSINNQISNGVAIDVQGGINPIQQQSNNPGNSYIGFNPWGNYPGYGTSSIGVPGGWYSGWGWDGGWGDKEKVAGTGTSGNNLNTATSTGTAGGVESITGAKLVKVAPKQGYPNAIGSVEGGIMY